MTFDEWWQQQGIPMHYRCFSGSDMRWIAELAWKQAMSEAVSVLAPRLEAHIKGN